MALDVHLIGRRRCFPYTGSYTGFGFDEGLIDILTVILVDVSAYPQLSHLRDYHDDTLYHHELLEQLSSETSRVLPKLPSGSLGEREMKRFHELIKQALLNDLNVMLFAD